MQQNDQKNDQQVIGQQGVPTGLPVSALGAGLPMQNSLQAQISSGSGFGSIHSTSMMSQGNSGLQSGLSANSDNMGLNRAGISTASLNMGLLQTGLGGAGNLQTLNFSTGLTGNNAGNNVQQQVSAQQNANTLNSQPNSALNTPNLMAQQLPPSQPLSASALGMLPFGSSNFNAGLNLSGVNSGLMNPGLMNSALGTGPASQCSAPIGMNTPGNVTPGRQSVTSIGTANGVFMGGVEGNGRVSMQSNGLPMQPISNNETQLIANQMNMNANANAANTTFNSSFGAQLQLQQVPFAQGPPSICSQSSFHSQSGGIITPQSGLDNFTNITSNQRGVSNITNPDGVVIPPLPKMAVDNTTPTTNATLTSNGRDRRESFVSNATGAGGPDEDLVCPEVGDDDAPSQYQIHLAGNCQPCYYHHKPGGCKKMETCPRCHYCSKERAKSFDKWTSAMKKRERAAQAGQPVDEEIRPPVVDANQLPAGTVVNRQNSRNSRSSRHSDRFEKSADRSGASDNRGKGSAENSKGAGKGGNNSSANNSTATPSTSYNAHNYSTSYGSGYAYVPPPVPPQAGFPYMGAAHPKHMAMPMHSAYPAYPGYPAGYQVQ